MLPNRGVFLPIPESIWSQIVRQSVTERRGAKDQAVVLIERALGLPSAPPALPVPPAPEQTNG